MWFTGGILFGYAFYPNHYQDEQGRIYFTFRGVANNETPPPGADFIANILYVENDPYNRNWESILPKKVSVSTTEFYHHPKVAVSEDNIRYLIWTVDKDLDIWCDDIYYSFSRDGQFWLAPQSIANKMDGHIIIEQNVAPDHVGNIHVNWRSWIVGPTGSLEIKHYYVILKEDNFSDVEKIPNMDHRRNARSLNMIIDEKNRTLLFWVENINLKDNSGNVIKYMWRNLPSMVLYNRDISEQTDNFEINSG